MAYEPWYYVTVALTKASHSGAALHFGKKGNSGICYKHKHTMMVPRSKVTPGSHRTNTTQSFRTECCPGLERVLLHDFTVQHGRSLGVQQGRRNSQNKLCSWDRAMVVKRVLPQQENSELYQCPSMILRFSRPMRGQGQHQNRKKGLHPPSQC